MKKYKKLFVSLLAAAVLTVGSAFSVMAADTYTYKVTVYAAIKARLTDRNRKRSQVFPLVHRLSWTSTASR